jgi:hypothetical protein
MYLDGCKTRDPDFLNRNNDNPFGKLTWMLDSTDEANASARIGPWGASECSISVPLSTKNLALGSHQIHLLVRDAATSLGDEPDDIVTIPFEVVADGEIVKPARKGEATMDVAMDEVMEIDVLSPMQFIDLPFTRRDLSIGVGLRFEIGIERQGDIKFEHIIDPANGTFDIVNASAQLSADADFRPWILFRYSIWDKTSREWKDGEVKIPMLSCESVYEGMPWLPTMGGLPENCSQLYYWDQALSINGISSNEFGAFTIDEQMDIAGIDIKFILDALSTSFPPLQQLLNLLDTIGSIEIPLTFGMQIDANGLLNIDINIFAEGATIDGQPSSQTNLLGANSIRESHHTLTDDSGFVALQAQAITNVAVTLTPTVGIGVEYSIFGFSVLEWSYTWELPAGTGIDRQAKYHSHDKALNQLWEI